MAAAAACGLDMWARLDAEQEARRQRREERREQAERRQNIQHESPAQSLGVERFHSGLLASRRFVLDMAIFAEHIVMNDVHEGFFQFDEACEARTVSTSDVVRARSLSARLRCREMAPWWAPDKVGQLSELPASKASSCSVRLRRAAWAIGFARRWSPEVIAWIDTGVGMEKAVSVLRLWGDSDTEPTIAIAFRGSKAAADYYITDANPFLVPLPGAGAGKTDRNGRVSSNGAALPPFYDPQDGIDEEQARFMPLLTSAPFPCATLGVWRAYAGSSGRCAAMESPRQRVRLAVEEALREFPRSKIVVTGHSLGGGLAALCAYDLIRCCAPLRDALERSGGALTLLTFAGPRMFNRAFFDVVAEMEAAGVIHALRVVVGADVIPRLAPHWLGGWPPCRGKLLLLPPASHVGDGVLQGTKAVGFEDSLKRAEDSVDQAIAPSDAPAAKALPRASWRDIFRTVDGLWSQSIQPGAAVMRPEDAEDAGKESTGMMSTLVKKDSAWGVVRKWFSTKGRHDASPSLEAGPERSGWEVVFNWLTSKDRAHLGKMGLHNGSHISFDDTDLHDARTWRILPGDAHACHALYLAGEVSAALTPAVPRDPSLHEDTWHFSEWPLSARKDAGNGTRGSCALQ